jgi:hypothetical protein
MSRDAPSRAASIATLEARKHEIVEALGAAGLEARVAEIEPLLRDAIAVTLLPATRKPIPAGTSRAGGSPELPAGLAWPEVGGAPLPFLAQIRLEEIAPYDVHLKLPAAGLLSMFAGKVLDGDGVSSVAARVLHVPANADLVEAKPPFKPLSPRRIAFAPRVALPPYGSRYLASDPAYRSFHDAHASEEEHGLFGYDRPLEGLLGPDDEILFRLDALYLILARDALAARDFARTRAVEGSAIGARRGTD